MTTAATPHHASRWAASLVADEARVAGLLCLGYPVHPVGQPEKLRTEFAWLPDGDHSWAPRKASGRTTGENLAAGVAAAVEWLEGR